MKTWMVGLGGLVLGGVLGFYVGATPLYLLFHTNGGPLKGPVESLERRVPVLVDPAVARPRTAAEVADYMTGLAGDDLVMVAMSYCRLPPDLQVRARSAAGRISPALNTKKGRHPSAVAALAYLTKVPENGSCSSFENPDMKLVTPEHQ
jgi:hypothetical protein